MLALGGTGRKTFKNYWLLSATRVWAARDWAEVRGGPGRAGPAGMKGGHRWSPACPLRLHQADAYACGDPRARLPPPRPPISILHSPLPRPWAAGPLSPSRGAWPDARLSRVRREAGTTAGAAAAAAAASNPPRRWCPWQCAHESRGRAPGVELGSAHLDPQGLTPGDPSPHAPVPRQVVGTPGRDLWRPAVPPSRRAGVGVGPAQGRGRPGTSRRRGGLEAPGDHTAPLYAPQRRGPDQRGPSTTSWTKPRQTQKASRPLSSKR